ncbi:glycosyltransferase family 4 protein [Mycobacterium sp. C31M]
MGEQRALWVSTSIDTRGGIASYVRAMQQTPLWREWNIRHIATHRDGSTMQKVTAFAIGTVQFLIELIRFRPDVIHLHASTRGSFVRKAILFWMSRPTRVPIVIHMHGSGFQGDYENSPRVVQAIVRATLGRADAFVTLGELWADRMRQIAPESRIVAIPNGVQLGRQVDQPAPDAPTHVVFLGRIGTHKGTYNLLDAWAKLACEPGFSMVDRCTARLTIAGDGDVERARKRIRELSLERSVEIHEWLSEKQVGELLDSAQVLVLPSRNEGQPMAVLEAMARGLCVIATAVGGLPEMIGDGCGVTIPPEDPEAITAALREVLADTEFRTRCGSAAHARVQAVFDTRTIARRLDALYREVCA